MKKIVTIIILFCFLLSLNGCTSKETTKEAGSENNKDVTGIETEDSNTEGLLENEETNYKSLSEALVLQMVEGEYKDTFDTLSTKVKSQVNEKALKEAWEATAAGMGNYIEVYEITEEAVNDFQIVNVILRYENNGLKASFTYNKSGLLDGLWFNYSPIEEEAVTNEVFEEIKISFGEDEYPVSGILTLPLDIDKPSVTILVPGSGTHDVNEIVGANKPFQDIAWGLAEQGIASIRYNERLMSYPSLADNDLTIELDSLTDAADAINYAVNCDKINKDKIIVVGHSLGGMMAPKIASDNKEVAGIIILAGSPRNLEEIVYDQVMDAIENAEGATQEQIDQTIKITEDSVKAIKNLDKSSKDALFGFPSSYWYGLNQIKTSDLVAELTIPIFIAQGSEDWQVFADKDYVMWQKILSEKENVTFHLYDNLNHLFMTSNGKTDVTEYNVKDNVEQVVIDDMAEWIKQ
ncbi:MAG: alpha/beta hydrolase [Mobilitalea sp.]